VELDRFVEWLDGYGEAWGGGNPEAAVALFSDEIRYFETPFDEPMSGKDAVYRYWREGAGESQRDVKFEHEAMAVVGNQGLAKWRASFVRIPSGNRVELDGFLVAEFDGTGKCATFREWWHRREVDGAPG